MKIIKTVWAERQLGYNGYQKPWVDAVVKSIYRPNLLIMVNKPYGQGFSWKKMPGTFRSGLTNGKTDTIQGIIFEKDSIKINGSKVDRNCSFSKIDQESKGNAFQVLQEVEQQVVQANFSESAVGGAITSIISQFSLFSLLSSPHYDATLAEYMESLQAKKRKARSRVRIHRIS